MRADLGDNVACMRPRPSFELFASDRLLEERAAIARDWCAAMSAVLGADPHRSGSDALDPAAVDAVLGRLAVYVLDGDEGAFGESPEVTKATYALGAWCAQHGSGARAAVSLFDRLAGILDRACHAWTVDFAGGPRAEEAVRVTGRLNRAPLHMAAHCIAAYERAWSATPAPGDFTELLAHELSTPINAAEVAAVLLENDRVTPGSQELRRLAGTIQRSLRRVRALIGDVRDLSAARSAPGHEEKLVPIGQLLGDVLAELAPQAREAGVRVDIEEPVPGIVVPSARTGIVLRNLVSNGIKYADGQARTRWVRVSFLPGADRWTVAVSDNGLGIARDQQHRVFERFVRLHPAHAEGTGLGLAIAHETALRMNGRLEFDSEPGVGSTFRFALPATDAG